MLIFLQKVDELAQQTAARLRAIHATRPHWSSTILEFDKAFHAACAQHVEDYSPLCEYLQEVDTNTAMTFLHYVQPPMSAIFSMLWNIGRTQAWYDRNVVLTDSFRVVREERSPPGYTRVQSVKWSAPDGSQDGMADIVILNIDGICNLNLDEMGECFSEPWVHGRQDAHRLIILDYGVDGAPELMKIMRHAMTHAASDVPPIDLGKLILFLMQYSYSPEHLFTRLKALAIQVMVFADDSITISLNQDLSEIKMVVGDDIIYVRLEHGGKVVMYDRDYSLTVLNDVGYLLAVYKKALTAHTAKANETKLLLNNS